MKKFLKALGLGLLASVFISTAVLAYTYSAPLTITEENGNAYDMLPVITETNIEWLADNDYIDADGLDTRVQTQGGANKPHLISEEKILTATNVPANSQTNLRFISGNTSLPSMDIITGYDGYITIPSSIGDATQLGNDFEIEVADAYINTDAGADKNLIHKEEAFRTYVSAEDEIASVILDADSINPADSMSGTPDNYAFVDHAVYATGHDAAAADSVGAGWRCGQNTGGAGFLFYRGYLIFDTSAIPDTATITSAVLHLRGSVDSSTTDFDVVIRNGQPARPSDPLVVADFDYTFYTGDGGSFNSAAFVIGDNPITLNADGMSWISKTGTTKLALISQEDIYSSQPVNAEYVTGTMALTTLTVNYYYPTAEVTAAGIPSGEYTVTTGIEIR